METSSSSRVCRRLIPLVLTFALGITGQNVLGNDYDSYLVARYNFEDTSHPYADSSGQNNNPDDFTSGSPADAFSTDAAVGQYAQEFFGDTSFSFTQYNPAYQSLSNALSGNFSVTAWVKTTNSVNDDYANAYYGAPAFFAGADYNSHCTIPLSITGSKAAFTIVSEDGPGTTTLHSTTSVNDGNYHFLAVTRQQSSGLMSVYVDGNLEATGTGITDPVITQGYITVAGGYNFYDGLLDDVRVYSTNLSASDVADINSGGDVVTLATAIGVPDLSVTTSGDTNWLVETTNTYNDAAYAAQSGSVTGSQSSTLSVTVTGPGTLTFLWSSIANDSNEGFDYEFDIDGNYADNITGDNSWVQEFDPNTGLPYNIPAGQHVLSWTVYANGDTDPTQAGYLDEVDYVTAAVPTLTVTASPANGQAPLIVQFTSPGTDGFGNTVTNWNWNFGDGAISSLQSPAHTYTNTGSFSPSLIAYSTYGTSPVSITGLGTISVTNPTINVTITPQSGAAPLTVQFTSPGVDSAGNIVTNWNWNFGDGGYSTAQNPTHVYGNVGSFSPNLTAYSTNGSSPLTVTGLGGVNVNANSFPAFHTLYTFSDFFGSGPNGDLALSGNTLYGTTVHGGTNGAGTVFAVKTDGTGFINLYNLSTSNGGDPVGGLVSSGGTVYGVGATVFAINTNGLGYSNLLSFIFSINSATGYEPVGGLAVAGNSLYGMTWYGGAYDRGTLYYVTTNGATNGKLHDFTTPSYNQYEYSINYDGIFPSARLISSGGILFGTTEQGGANGSGTIFSVVTNQPASFNVVHSFAAVDPATGTNNEGAFSFSGLVLSGDTLYGTTFGGGTNGDGAIFAVNTNGLGFINLYSFTGGNDGSGPRAGLTLSGNTLYGTTVGGGTSSNGTLFAINTDGSGFTSLYSFTGSSDGADPQTDLVLSGNTLYGTTAAGGDSGDGTIFSFALPYPHLNILRSGTNVILTWSNSIPAYTLQSSSQLGAATAWNSVTPLPVIVGGLNFVTNAIGPASKFYRLSP